jgi:hypothetical protein
VIITAIDEIRKLRLWELWDNYSDATGAAIRLAKMGDKYAAALYLATAKISMELYFERIEEEICRREDGLDWYRLG